MTSKEHKFVAEERKGCESRPQSQVDAWTDSADDALILTYNHEKEIKLPDNSKKKMSILTKKLCKLILQIGSAGLFFAIFTVIILSVRFSITQPKMISLVYFTDYAEIGLFVLLVAIPEGLPIAIFFILFYSVKKMKKDKIIVRRLTFCETLGNSTSLCIHTKGLLTTNRMTVVQLFTCDIYCKTIHEICDIPTEITELIIRAITITNNYKSRQAQFEDLNQNAGKKMERALENFIRDIGRDLNAIQSDLTEDNIFKFHPFNSIRKTSSTIVSLGNGRYQLFTKGSPERIIPKCLFIYGKNGKVVRLTEERRNLLYNEVIKSMSWDGLRIVVIAYKEFTSQVEELDEEENIDNLTFVCLCGIDDPIRPEVPRAIKKCHLAGITVRVITEDNIDVARSVSRKCGIINIQDDYFAFDSKEFNAKIRNENGEVQQDLIDKIWPRLRILARSSFADKFILVKGIVDSKLSPNRVVAITGDDVKDELAFKKADLAISKKTSQSSASNASSDLILVDDNFNIIVKAVIWGRKVQENISKYLQLQLTVNIVASIVVFTGFFSPYKTSPLTVMQVLWINLFVTTFSSLALMTERPSSKLLLRQPSGRNASFLSKMTIVNIFGRAIYQISILCWLIFYGDKFFDFEMCSTFMHAPPCQHFTIIFNTFVLMILFNEINVRRINGEINVFSRIHRHLMFCETWIATLVIQVVIVEWGDRLFFSEQLALDHWLWCFFFGLGVMVWELVIKFVVKVVKFLEISSQFCWFWKKEEVDIAKNTRGQFEIAESTI